MTRSVFVIRSTWIFITSIATMLLIAATVFASVTNVTMNGLQPDAPIVLTKDDDPNVKVEGKADKTGTFTFQLGQWNLPAGSSVRVGVVGGESKVIPKLADGSSTRDFGNPDRGANGGKAPDHGWSVDGQIGYGWRQVGNAAGGTNPATDEVIANSRGWIRGVKPKVYLKGNALGQDVEFALDGFIGDDTTNRNNATVGAVTFDKPVNGVRGINTGAAARAEATVDGDGVNFRAGLPSAFYEYKIPGFEIAAGFALNVGYNRDKYRTSFQNLGFPNVSSDRKRKVEQIYGGPGATLQKIFHVTDHVEIYAGFSWDAVYSDTAYQGDQKTKCAACASPFDNVNIKTRDHHSGWIFRPTASAGIEYEFNSSSIGLNANYEYWHKRSVFDERDNPLDDSPGLRKKAVHAIGLGVFYQYKFH